MALGAGLLLAGVWGWERQITSAESAAREVAIQAARLQAEGRYPEALVVAQRTADLLPRFGGDRELRRQVAAQVADLKLLNDLENARLEMSVVAADGTGFDSY